MRIAIAVLVITLSGLSVFAQAPPTLRIVTEVPTLPSELFYGDVRVKPLRLRPGTNTPITIDDADFFVAEHYFSFLSRVPDSSGFAFWKNQIDSCGGDAVCRDLRRINVSGAFFLSIEFKETGYFVYLVNKAAFGDLPGKPVPVVRATFMPETRTVGQGVVIGNPGDLATLNANKDAFVLAFVQRPTFQAAFPAGMTAAAFVDQMDTNAGLVLSSTERTNFINMLGATPGDALLRSRVLRGFAENSNFQAQNFNKAFVFMQYAGYMKRDPDASPDSDFSGFSFWLNKLNQFNGNFVDAEMVKAFIVSGEFRNRF
jgi:hypothetical protein